MKYSTQHLRKLLFLSYLLVTAGMGSAQLLYYSSNFNGGTTAGGWAPSLGGSGTGNFDIQIYPGSTIHQAFLIGCGHGPNTGFTVVLNGANVTFSLADEASSFPDPTYGGNCIVSVVDVTALIDPAVNAYTLTTPVQGADTGFEGYMLFVAYEHADLSPVVTYLYLNDQAMAPGAVYWSLSGMDPFPATGNIGVSMMFDYACDYNSDAEYVDVNGTYIGNCGGTDYNSGSCAGILGNYYYENGVTTGMNNDTADGTIAAGDALWNADAYVSPGDTGLDLVMYDGPAYEGFDNGFYLAIFTYGSLCDIPPYTVSNDVTICPGQSTQLEASGGTGYTWSPASTLDDASSATPVASPAATTTYSVQIEFDNGCSANSSVVVTVDNNALDFTADLFPPLCSGTGTIEVTNVTGATGIVTYSIDGTSQPGPVFSNVDPGTYTISVVDEMGCSGMQDVDLITDTYVVDFDVQLTAPYCDVTGQLEVTSVNNGTAPYVYELDGVVQPDPVFENLPAAAYTITVSDAIGCVGTQVVDLAEEPPVISYDAVVEDVMCAGTGSIEITNVQGLTGPITYAMNGVEQASGLFEDLVPGNYSFTLTGDLGCITSFIVPVELITYEVDFNVDITEQLCLTPGQLEVSSINNGVAPYAFELNNAPEPDAIFENLVAGNYTITVTDTAGCSGTQTIALPALNPALDFDVLSSDVICQRPGSLEIVNPDGLAPFLLSVDGNEVDGLALDSLASGDHDVFITDANGCTGATTVNLLYLNPAIADATTSVLEGGIPFTVDFFNESVALDNFAWSFGNGDSLFTQDASYTFEIPGTYTVEMFGYDSVYGCFDSLSFKVITDIYALYVPNAFSPDGDGINEYFIPSGSGMDPEYYTFRIFDRWGEVLFETTDVTKAWIGNANGGEYFVPAGVYVYQVEYRFRDSIDQLQQTGHVTVIR